MRHFSLRASALVLGMACAGSLSTSLHAAEECDCRHLEALQVDLRNAVYLQKAFLEKIPDLRAHGHGSSVSAYKDFSERIGSLPAPPGYTGPERVDYTAYGDGFTREIEELTQGKKKADKSRSDQLCQPSDQAAIDLKLAEDGSVCNGMARAIRAHEQHHHAFCRAIGFLDYYWMHGADRAQEEVEAYGAQIAVLRAEIDQLKWNCDYRVEQSAGWDARGLKCDGPAGEWNIHIETPLGWGSATSDFSILINREDLRGSYNETTKMPLHDGGICIYTSTGDAAFFDDETPWPLDLSFRHGTWRCEGGRPRNQGGNGYNGLGGRMEFGHTELPPLERGEFCTR
jgi:hypothetical protein